MASGDELAAVVFDLGGVLIDWNPEYLYRQLIPNHAERSSFLDTVCTSTWNHSMDAGRSVPEAVANLAGEHPEHAAWINAWWEEWPEMLRGHYPETLKIARDLSDRSLPLFALTNWAAETWPYAVQRFEFLSSLFEGIVVSGQERVAKPDPTIFRVLEERYDLDPVRTAFIDDSEVNVIAAAARGYSAHHYTGPANLRRWLEGYAIVRGS